MIDRPARDKLALDLRRLVSGMITNDDFEAEDRPSGDAAIRAMEGQAWFLYSDLYNHRLTGKHRLDRVDRRVVASWIAFLDSDFEFIWPVDFRRAPPMFLVWLFPRRYGPRKEEAEKCKVALALDFWPFASAEDRDCALNNPRRLAGRAA